MPSTWVRASENAISSDEFRLLLPGAVLTLGLLASQDPKLPLQAGAAAETHRMSQLQSVSSESY